MGLILRLTSFLFQLLTFLFQSVIFCIQNSSCIQSSVNPHSLFAHTMFSVQNALSPSLLSAYSFLHSLYSTASVHYQPLGIGDTLATQAKRNVHKHRLIHEGQSTSFSWGTTTPQMLTCYKGRRAFSISKAYSYTYSRCFLIVVLTQITPLPPKKQLQPSSADNFRKST